MFVISLIYYKIINIKNSVFLYFYVKLISMKIEEGDKNNFLIYKLFDVFIYC